MCVTRSSLHDFARSASWGDPAPPHPLSFVLSAFGLALSRSSFARPTASLAFAHFRSVPPLVRSDSVHSRLYIRSPSSPKSSSAEPTGGGASALAFALLRFSSPCRGGGLHPPHTPLGFVARPIASLPAALRCGARRSEIRFASLSPDCARRARQFLPSLTPCLLRSPRSPGLARSTSLPFPALTTPLKSLEAH